MNFEDEKKEPNTGVNEVRTDTESEEKDEVKKPVSVGKEILDWVVAIAFAVIVALVVKKMMIVRISMVKYVLLKITLKM